MSRFVSCLVFTSLGLVLASSACGQSSDALSIEGAKESLFSDEKDVWGEVPEFVQGASILRPAMGNRLHFTAKKEAQVLVVASWIADGEVSDDWYPTRSSQVDLYKQGWQVIGLMKKKNQEYNFILRKTVKAGEEVKIHTRKVAPPFILQPAASQLDAVAKAVAYRTAAHSLSLLKPPPPGPAGASGKAVLLRTSEPDLYEAFEHRGTLLRELVRQSILLAARDELGLATRDETLHEYWTNGPADGPLPLDVIVSATEDHRVKVTFCRMHEDTADILWDEELRLPQGDDLILALAVKAESLSRKEFVNALKTAGFQGVANPSLDEKPVPAEISGAKMHLISQFAAARRLHDLIKAEGESPERLAALARTYAQLGLLSEHFWYQGHKAFLARSLLYAQRALARWPQSSTARYARGYALAIAGLHAAALDDLEAAAKLPGGDKPPEWIAGIEAYCRFDLKKLDEIAESKTRLPLLLRLLVQTDLQSGRPVNNAINKLLMDVTDCDRAMEAVFSGPFNVDSFAQSQTHRRTGEVALLLPTKIPDLPAAAAEICKAELKSRTMMGLLDEQAEHPRRGEFIEALREDAKTTFDIHEPSWQVLATLVEELSFAQTVRSSWFLDFGLGVLSEGLRTSLAPTVAHHPLRDLLDSFGPDIKLRKQYLLNLVQNLREPDLSVNQYKMRIWGRGAATKEREDRYAALMQAHQDLTYRDLLQTIPIAQKPLRKGLASELRRVSPHSPLSTAITIENDWESVEPREAQLEEQFSTSWQVLYLLAHQYHEQKKNADAIRCLEKATELRWDLDVFDLLAKSHLAEKDEEKWKATWDKFLTGRETGLSHSSARVRVAEHYMRQGKFDAALPYSEAAAQSYASWALVSAADCLSGLGRYEEAEKYLDANSRRYPADGLFTAHIWHEQFNQGDLKKEREKILAHLTEREGKIGAGAVVQVLLLVGEKDKALQTLRRWQVQVPNPYFAWHAALLFDEAKESRNRDISLQMAIDSIVVPKQERDDLQAMAKLCKPALTDPAKLEGLAKELDGFLAAIDNPRRRCDASYLAGKFLVQRGKKAEGEALLKRAAQSPFTQVEAALAAQEFREKKAANPDDEK